MMIHYSDETLLEGLRQRKTRDVERIYKEFEPVLRHFIRKNSGTNEDFEDIMQDAMHVLFVRSRAPAFKLNCSLKTYFMSICKNLWLQRLDRKYRLHYQADYEVNEQQMSYTPEEDALREENLEIWRLFYNHLQMLPPSCRRLLELFCLNIPMEQIAKLLKISSVDYIKTRKYSCKNLLRKRIISDPEFSQYLEYENIRDKQRLD